MTGARARTKADTQGQCGESGPQGNLLYFTSEEFGKAMESSE